MNSNIDIQSEFHGDVTLIKLNGRIDHITASYTSEQLNKFLLKSKIILDLSGLDYISSSGLSVLLIFSNKMQKNNGKKLVLCAPRPDISNLFKMTKFDEFFLIFDTEKDAMHALS